MRRSLLAAALWFGIGWFGIGLLGIGTAAPALAAPDPGAFINTMGNEALATLNATNSPAQRVVAFRALFRRDFDVPQIARFVLGPYWRVATPTQQQEFVRLFTNYVALAYSSRLSQFSSERLVVTGSRPIPGGAIVTSQVGRPSGGQPIVIDWRLTRQDGTYKVNDIVLDGISMAVTQRSEFASVIQRNGGNLQALLAALRAKTAGIEGS